MSPDSNTSMPSSPEGVAPEAGKIFAFNKNGGAVERTMAPFATPEKPQEANEVPVSASENLDNGTVIPINVEAPQGYPEVPEVWDPTPTGEPAPTPEQPVVMPETKPVEIDRTDRALPDFPAAADTELTAEETASIETAPDEAPAPELEILSDVEAPAGEVEVKAEEDLTDENAIDVDAAVKKAEDKEAELEEAKHEAIEMIDKEIARIDKKALQIAEDHREHLHAYRTEKETLENARMAMVELRKQTAAKLKFKEDGKGSPEALAA
jgi:hypothetical protein